MKLNFHKRYLAAAGLSLAVVAAIVHAESGSQVRLCRSILLILNPAESELQVVSSNLTAAGNAVVITYSVTPPGQRTRNRQLMCAFSHNTFGRDELQSILSDGRNLGPVRLALIKRFWLGSAEAAEADRVIAETRHR